MDVVEQTISTAVRHTGEIGQRTTDRITVDRWFGIGDRVIPNRQRAHRGE